MNVDRYITNNRLNCNIYNGDGRLLVGVGTPLTKNIKKRLENIIWYVDKPSEYIYDNIALLEDDVSSVITNYGINSSALLIKAKEIVDLVMNNPIIFTSLSQIKGYDQYTYNHCSQVACLAVAMGIKLNLNNHDLINLAISSLTHDIGKCLIDPNIINKPGKLSKEEYEIVKKHSLFGYEMLKKSCDIDSIVADTILYHHENFDGTGYPFGLKEKQIPVSASIIHVCDVYDALVSERPYKNKLNELDSINILKKDRGIMFNPNVLDVFCSSIQIYGIGSVVELENGKKIVIKNIKKDKNGKVEEIIFTDYTPQKQDVKKRILTKKLG